MQTLQKIFDLSRSIGIDLSRKTNTDIPQQINFTGKLEDDGATMSFFAEKQWSAILNFSLNSLIVSE